MPYNLNLTHNIQNILGDRPGFVEKKMFGGVGAVLSQAYVKPFLTPGGKPMPGWVLVGIQGLVTDQGLRRWVEQAYEFALSLPEKK